MSPFAVLGVLFGHLLLRNETAFEVDLKRLDRCPKFGKI
jgi:hypothetical protein